MTEAPEPEDKLDATTTIVGIANGPEDATPAWRQIDWRQVEADVRRLRQRIFTASQAGDLKRVRSLQKLMLRSRANTLASVRRVTERNAGRLTAGVDGEVVLTPEAKLKLANRIQHPTEPFKAQPVRRVYIPKKGSSTKRRPLGIPVILDRCHQARVVNALEPEWEARFEPRSYGPGPPRPTPNRENAPHTPHAASPVAAAHGAAGPRRRAQRRPARAAPRPPARARAPRRARRVGRRLAGGRRRPGPGGTGGAVALRLGERGPLSPPQPGRHEGAFLPGTASGAAPTSWHAGSTTARMARSSASC
jgi:hypothetical protein